MTAKQQQFVRDMALFFSHVTEQCKRVSVAVIYCHLHLVRLGQSRRRRFCILQVLFGQRSGILNMLD